MRIGTKKFSFLAASFVLPLALTCWTSAQSYTVTDLGTLGGPSSVGDAINSAGQVTGYSNTPPQFNPAHAFLYSNGTMQDLGTLGGLYSAGLGINDAGQVAGGSTLAGDSVSHAFLYSDGTMKDLGALSSGGSQAYAINNAGVVAVVDSPVLVAAGRMPDAIHRSSRLHRSFLNEVW